MARQGEKEMSGAWDAWLGLEPESSETDEQRCARERRERTAALLKEDALYGGNRAPQRPSDDLPTLWKQAARSTPVLRGRRR